MTRKVPAPKHPSGLFHARTAAGMSQDRLSELSGVPKGTISKLERTPAGGGIKLTREWAERLAPVLNVTAQQILFWDQELIATPTRVIRPSGPEPSEVTKVGEGWPDVGDEWMDVRGVTVGGDDSFFYFGDVIDQVRRPPGIRNAKNVAALNVAGESMVPRFEPGELIYVQLREPAPGDDVVVELYPETEGDAPKSFLKRLVAKTGRRLECRQHNPAAPIEFDRGEVKNLWRVLTLRDLLG